MQFSIFSIGLSLLPLTLAQYGSPSNDNPPASVVTTSASPSASVITTKIHKVSVGQGGNLVFSPNSITAAVGDYVEWHFFPNTHSVVQATFSAPCAPRAGAFTSGGFATTSGENAKVFRIQVNSTTPMWYYCGFPGHCQTGMVGVINPPSNATIEQFIAAAASAPSVPGVAVVNGGVVGPAAVQSTAAPTATQSTVPQSAGIEAAGGVKWVLLGLTGCAAVLVGMVIV